MSEDTKSIKVPCVGCGEPVDIVQPAHSDCVGHTIPDFEDQCVSDTLEKDKVMQLIELWRGQQEDYPSDIEGEVAAGAVRACADELEQLVENGELVEIKEY
jgi:hypothetical protein